MNTSDGIDAAPRAARRTLSRRGVAAGVVLLLWLAGFSILAARELFQGKMQELAQAGRLIEPGGDFYTVTRAGKQIGFMSATADTFPYGIALSQLLVTEHKVGRALRRREVRTTVRLTHAMQLLGFTRQFGVDTAALVVAGEVHGDSSITITTRAGSSAPRVRTVRITTPLLLPMEVPLVIALGSTPKIGQSYHYTVFDPVRLALGDATLRVVAESLFVLSDSATFDSTGGRWVAAHDTTVRAWRIEEPSGNSSLDAWIDASGHLVETRRSGSLTLHRTAYELAFQNWSEASKRQRRTLMNRP